MQPRKWYKGDGDREQTGKRTGKEDAYIDRRCDSGLRQLVEALQRLADELARMLSCIKELSSLGDFAAGAADDEGSQISGPSARSPAKIPYSGCGMRRWTAATGT